jgi:DNA primase small subunit
VSNIETKVFIQSRFAEYYRSNASSIEPPSFVQNREFAFLLFKERMMLRHKRAKSVGEFRTLLEAVIPSDVYYSSAYFENPDEEMDSKGWLGADLVFDIDADHISTPCEKKHDTWVCSSCGSAGKGAPPEKCPKCKKLKFEDKSWPCETCLDTTKNETRKLVVILTDDFGLSPRELTVAFSGHRGYHVHVESEVVQGLDQMARREIVDYLMGIGLEPKFHGFGQDKGPGLKEKGRRGRIARGLSDFLRNTNAKQLKEVGLRQSSLRLMELRDQLLEGWSSRGWVWRPELLSPEGWNRLQKKIVELQAVQIDTVVTTDIHRLIRLADTLHGKTGLKKVIVPISHIDEFDPLKSAVAFKGGSVRLLVSEAPEFRLGEETFGPFKNAEVELPTAAALFLLCKGAAKLKETN